MEMIIHWMRVGFVHGVMNTDNMSILGLTIDYGPYGWLEDYTPDWTPNTTDAAGRRYSFKNQSQIALWNLGQLANAILPVTGNSESLQAALDDTIAAYTNGWQAMMAKKLGLALFDPNADKPMINDLLVLLQTLETDYTLFFRGLSKFQSNGNSNQELPPVLTQALYQPDQIGPEYIARANTWFKVYKKRVDMDGISHQVRQGAMDRINPKYVLRNYLAQTAIDKAEKGDFSRVTQLLELLRRPYDEQPGQEKFAEKRPEWARHKPGCSMLSCSS